MIAAEFARVLGIPVTRQANITDIIEAVCGVCTDTRTSVICVDFSDRPVRRPPRPASLLLAA